MEQLNHVVASNQHTDLIRYTPGFHFTTCLQNPMYRMRENAQAQQLNVICKLCLQEQTNWSVGLERASKGPHIYTRFVKRARVRRTKQSHLC